jgi:hypothetical protein
MNIKITQKQLIIANIIVFVMSAIFLEYSQIFRMSLEKHWIYSFVHNWWFMIGIPSAFWGSLILGSYSLWKVKKNKFLYFIFSIIPFILFIIFISI